MKKRILVLLAVLALMVTCMVFSASAATDISGDWRCPCCGKASSEITWIEFGASTSYNFSSSNASGKHYKVSKFNGNLNNAASIVGDANNDGKIVIVLTSNVWGYGKGTTSNGGRRALPVAENTEAWIIGGGSSDKIFSSMVHNGVGGVVYVPSGSTLHLSNVTLTTGLYSSSYAYGVPTQGGLIYNAGTVDLDNVTLTPTGACTTGGAIYNTGTVTLDNCTVGGAPVTGQGGAIYNKGGSVTIADSTITAGDMAGFSPSAGCGGAIYHESGSLSITDTEMTISGQSYRGGLLYSAGGTISLTGATLDASNATNTNRGGAIYHVGGSLTMSGCEVTGAKVADNGAAMTIGANATITNSTISGGECTNWGGNIFFAGGTTTIEGTTISGGVAPNGGNIYAYTGTVTIQNTATNNALIENGKADTYGGNIYVASGATVNLVSGTITGGNSTKDDALTDTNAFGGNVYTAGVNKFVVTGGTISNGKAYKGGNVYVTATTSISGATISGGQANQGGNLFLASTLTLTSTTVDGENGSGNAGGNLYMYSGTLNLENGATMKNGTAGSGGNIYVGNTADDACTVNIKAGSKIIDGTSTNYGGNIYTNKNVTIIMTGGEISGGQGDVNNTTNKVFDGDNVYLVGGNTMTMTGGKIVPINESREWTDKSKAAVVGNGIYCSGAATVEIGGDAEIINSNKFGGVYIPAAASLTVLEGFSGKVSAYIEGHVTLASGETGYGKDFDSEVTCTGAFTGKLYVESTSGMVISSNYEPAVVRKGDTTTLTVCSARVTSAEGTEWYATMADAVAAADGDATKYVALFRNDSVTVNEGQVVYINFAGKDATVTNNGTIYGFDSTCSATKEGNTEVTLSEGSNALQTKVESPAPDGHLYAALVSEGKTTFHELTLEIVSVNLRPSAETASLYYTADIKGDATLMAKVKKAGVAVTLKGDAAPNALDDYMYTTVPAANGDYNGALVAGIINNNGSEDNGVRATTEIYARAYIDLNGEIIMSERVDWSLLDVVNEVAGMYGELGDLQSYFDSLYAWCSEIVLPGDKVWADKAEAAV